MAYNFPGVPAAAMPPMGMLESHNHILYIIIHLHLSEHVFFITVFKVTFILL